MVQVSVHNELHPSTARYFLWQSLSLPDTTSLHFLVVECVKEYLHWCQLLKSLYLSFFVSIWQLASASFKPWLLQPPLFLSLSLRFSCTKTSGFGVGRRKAAVTNSKESVSTKLSIYYSYNLFRYSLLCFGFDLNDRISKLIVSWALWQHFKILGVSLGGTCFSLGPFCMTKCLEGSIPPNIIIDFFFFSPF